MRRVLLPLVVLATFVSAPPLQAQAEPDSDSEFVFRSLQTRIVAGDAAETDRFGESVSISEDRVLIGAQGNDEQAGSSGAAYVFVRSGGGWVQEAKLSPSDGAASYAFGGSVALLGDRALVGARGSNGNADRSGAAYVFVRSGGTWTEEAKLVAADGEAGDLFGSSVSLSPDRALVGATGDDDLGDFSGAAYVFARSGETWTQEAKLVAADGVAVDLFGDDVSLSGDRALIGAVGHESNSRDGAAFIFVRSGTTWSQERKLISSDLVTISNFGSSVSLSSDYALVGAPGDDSAYVFARSGSAWSQRAKLTAEPGTDDNYFGGAVALSGDRALIGARGGEGPVQASGTAYVFERNGSAWVQRATLTNGFQQDTFAGSVALSGDQAIVGAEGDDSVGSNSGAAYVFTEVGIVDAEGRPAANAVLSGPRPNPASLTATLVLSVDTPQTVRATLHDTLGREVAALFDAAVSGSADLTIDTSRLAPGVYVVRVEGESFAETRRLTVVR